MKTIDLVCDVLVGISGILLILDVFGIALFIGTIAILYTVSKLAVATIE